MNATPTPAADGSLDTSSLEQMLGYHLRRASLVTTGSFMDSMVELELRPVDFSVLNLLLTNTGVTSRQLCRALNVLPPNMVAVINALEKRGVLTRHQNARDKRSEILQITASGKKLILQALQQAIASDQAATAKLTARERASLARMLKKIYAG